MTKAAVPLVVVWGLLGCANTAGQVRKYTYPPSFKYIAQNSMRSSMTELAGLSQTLDETLRVNDFGTIDKAKVIALLDAMSVELGKLDPVGRRTNHPMIDANLEYFKADVSFARESATREPPNYYLAGTVAGACSYCHVERAH